MHSYLLTYKFDLQLWCPKIGMLHLQLSLHRLLHHYSLIPQSHTQSLHDHSLMYPFLNTSLHYCLSILLLYSIPYIRSLLRCRQLQSLCLLRHSFYLYLLPAKKAPAKKAAAGAKKAPAKKAPAKKAAKKAPAKKAAKKAPAKKKK